MAQNTDVLELFIIQRDTQVEQVAAAQGQILRNQLCQSEILVIRFRSVGRLLISLPQIHTLFEHRV
jgi:hypothetical protein